jgi:hypothetical protein
LYAGATLAAATFVAYLIAGSFGLVGVPFGPLNSAPLPVTPAIASANETRAEVGVPPPSVSASITSPSTERHSADQSPPSADITSPGGAALSTTESSKVTGTANDDGSGVDKVIVVFDRGSGDVTSVPASVSCSDAHRRRCTWSAEVPDLAGDYEVTAQVTDRSGNASATEPTRLTAVNPGGTLDDVLPADVIAELLRLLAG